MKSLIPLLCLFFCACVSKPPLLPPKKPIVLLISFDGFRYDYLKMKEAVNLRKFAAEGVEADYLKPVFPTLTFPNHYSIITGLLPEHHGIVANDIYDPKTQKRFTLKDQKGLLDSEWWGGEPLWVTVRKQGGISATMFWVGSFAEIKGLRPNYWLDYDATLPNADRIKKVLSWLDLPSTERPDFITLYLDDTDKTGHDVGPNHPNMNAAVKRIDNAFGTLLEGINARSLQNYIDILVVSDHGMREVKAENVLSLSETLKPEDGIVVGSGPVLGIWPNAKTGAAQKKLITRLSAKLHSKARVFRKNEIPKEFHYKAHWRIPPILILANPGTYISPGPIDPNWPKDKVFGAHGYQNSDPDMGGIFLARGPHIRQKTRVASFDNVDVYEIVTSLLKIKPHPNDSRVKTYKEVLSTEAPSESEETPPVSP